MFIKVTDVQGQEADINTDHIVTLCDGELSMSNNVRIILDIPSLVIVKSLMYPEKRTAKSTEPKTELAELFDQLHKLTGGKGSTVFTLQREKKLNDLLTKHRMTKENLITAATNIGNDEFLQGENESKKRYGNIDYLLRPDKAAKWSEEQAQDKKKRMF